MADSVHAAPVLDWVTRAACVALEGFITEEQTDGDGDAQRDRVRQRLFEMLRVDWESEVGMDISSASKSMEGYDEHLSPSAHNIPVQREATGVVIIAALVSCTETLLRAAGEAVTARRAEADFPESGRYRAISDKDVRCAWPGFEGWGDPPPESQEGSADGQAESCIGRGGEDLLLKVFDVSMKTVSYRAHEIVAGGTGLAETSKNKKEVNSEAVWEAWKGGGFYLPPSSGPPGEAFFPFWEPRLQLLLNSTALRGAVDSPEEGNSGDESETPDPGGTFSPVGPLDVAALGHLMLGDEDSESSIAPIAPPQFSEQGEEGVPPAPDPPS